MTRLLTNEEIAAHFSVDDCLEILETALEALGADEAASNAVESLLAPAPRPPDGTETPVYYGLRSMGGVVTALGVAAIRLTSTLLHWPHHPETGVRVKEKIPGPTGRVSGLVLVYDLETCEPVLVYPDGYIQAHRVAATSALGAKHLAREDAGTVGLLGAGHQARAHLSALDLVRDLKRVRVYSPTPSSREHFANEFDSVLDAAAEAVESAKEAVRGADIVQCATNATTAVFDPDWLEPGSHVGLIREVEAPAGFWEPDAWEALVQSHPRTAVSYELFGRQLTRRSLPARVWNFYPVEGDEPVPRLSGAVYDSEETVDWARIPGLGEVIRDPSLGRRSAEGITAFYNAGIGAQFAAIGRLLWDLAVRHDLGRELPTDLLTQEAFGH